ncbi:MAG: rRNA maturation RNase YbeY [Candidatus Marinimicrobia bacterium]|nr:rRNA maturation RNase YbeY [Candidatus Neomarinimicrobiota bacterium]
MKRFLKKKKINEGVISLKIVTRQEMRNLNKQYRGLDEPTTVLTFSQQETKKGQAFPQPLKVIGDLVICLEEMEEKSLSLEELLIHGLKNLISGQPELLPQISSSKSNRT